MNGKLFVNLLRKKNDDSKPYNGSSMRNVIKTFGYLICKQAEEIDFVKRYANKQEFKIADCIKKDEKNIAKINMLLEENRKMIDKYSILEDKFENIVSESIIGYLIQNHGELPSYYE